MGVMKNAGEALKAARRAERDAKKDIKALERVVHPHAAAVQLDSPAPAHPPELEVGADLLSRVIRGPAHTGYFRQMPTDEGHVHMIFKWTSGTWAGHYVYVRCNVADSLLHCFTLLDEKRRQVLAGERKPTKDKGRD